MEEQQGLCSLAQLLLVVGCSGWKKEERLRLDARASTSLVHCVKMKWTEKGTYQNSLHIVGLSFVCEAFMLCKCVHL